MKHRVLIEQCRPVGDDRALVLRGDGWLLACVADGAGGMGGGGRAADDVIASVAQFADDALSPTPKRAPGERDLLRALRALDGRMAAAGGETTATIAVVTEYLVYGVSVGDSEALYLVDQTVERLTARQQRKPLLGSGQAVVTGFGAVAAPGARLLLASDGLIKHAPRAAIEDALRHADIDAVAPALLGAARLPNGELADDVAIVVIEIDHAS